MSNIYDILYNFEITIDNYAEKIFEFNEDKIFEMLDELYDEIGPENTSQSNGYVFSTNSDFSGSRKICVELSCRKKRLLELSKFALLFADTILIEFPLTIYLRVRNIDDEIKNMIIEDIELIYWMRDFIDSGIFTFSVNINHLCPDCYMKVVNINECRRLLDIKSNINEELINSVECYIDKNDYGNTIQINGLSSVNSHDTMLLILGDDYKSDILKLRNGQKLSKKLIRKFRVVDDFVDGIFDDLLTSSWLKSEYNTKYVTNRKMDIDVLSREKQYLTNSNVLMKGIEHIVPNIFDIPLEDMIYLRKDEHYSFKVYRDSIMKVANMQNIKDVNECRKAFDDEIRPKLNKLELQIDRHKRRTINRTIAGTLAGVGLFSVGTVTNLIPHSFVEQIFSLGGLEALINLGLKVTDLNTPDYKDDDLYFLWRIKEFQKK
ncbi:hypothetical protein [Fusibacter ferrireducens]|uniref:Uncharacterized protein n=1 Tax=Fusibacter ferrireducens TaxID=2785058 RepID=A0ABR9ZZM5_9FIRM|nr:hypothetical protein [Fusibacter ferrireducens]MBF4695908.1 hypothetical protein [Fusibacter ferrireducens]